LAHPVDIFTELLNYLLFLLLGLRELYCFTVVIVIIGTAADAVKLCAI